MAHVPDDQLFPTRREPGAFWERTGLTPRQERRFDIGLYVLLGVLVLGWVYSVGAALDRGEAPQMARRIAEGPLSPVAPDIGPDATNLITLAQRQFIDWDELRGESGAVRVVLQEPGDTLPLPDSLPAGVDIALRSAEDTTAPPAAGAGGAQQPGIWNLMLRVRDAMQPVPDVNVISLVPRGELQGGRIGSYRIGNWPNRTGVYAPPRGFVKVTPENRNTPVSEHFVLGDFLTKGQENVWPKYVVISPRLLDKLELTLQELERSGHPVENVFVVSGFRTPWYNAAGGNTQGRGALSRHMYGDAADIAIDNDRDGRMDDLNGDGRVTVADARVVSQAAERVEKRHPNLIGGIGVYRPTGAHSGMVHIDTRGSRARW